MTKPIVKMTNELKSITAVITEAKKAGFDPKLTEAGYYVKITCPNCKAQKDMIEATLGHSLSKYLWVNTTNAMIFTHAAGSVVHACRCGYRKRFYPSNTTSGTTPPKKPMVFKEKCTQPGCIATLHKDGRCYKCFPLSEQEQRDRGITVKPIKFKDVSPTAPTCKGFVNKPCSNPAPAGRKRCYTCVPDRSQQGAPIQEGDRQGATTLHA